MTDLSSSIDQLKVVVGSYKMDPEVKQKWIDALLSGDYEQGRKVLKSSDEQYCCLGVLGSLLPDYKIIDNDNVCSSFIKDGNEYEYCGVLDEGTLPQNIQTKLAYYNDQGKTFEEIAELIKETL